MSVKRNKINAPTSSKRRRMTTKIDTAPTLKPTPLSPSQRKRAFDDLDNQFKRFKYCVEHDKDPSGIVYIPTSPTSYWRSIYNPKPQGDIYKLYCKFELYKQEHYYSDGQWHSSDLTCPLYLPKEPSADHVIEIETEVYKKI